MREFDLNVEKVLENWTVAHAIREIIANALDEQHITGTDEMQVFKDDAGRWHIRDFGRGLKYQHLTQNENEEKQNHPNLIGKFGVGLKDALATFDRNDVGVEVDSKYGHITIGKSEKHGFDDIITLHAYIDEAVDPSFIGTEFTLTGCSASQVKNAMDLFLCFTDIEVLDRTPAGEILEKRTDVAEIFINGIKVAEEENFLFSYNITSITATLKKALNRERTNVGRSAYTDRIKAILLASENEDVIDELTDNLEEMSSGNQTDELKWIEVQKHAIKQLNAIEDTVFVTPTEIQNTNGAILDIVRNSGKKPVFITENVMKRVNEEVDVQGNQISTISTVLEDYKESFEYDFVTYNELTPSEQYVYDMTDLILSEMESNLQKEQIRISTCLQPELYADTYAGIWDQEEQIVVIRRDMLADVSTYLGVLAHELVHADTDLPDVCRAFETVLTKWIGHFASKVLH